MTLWASKKEKFILYNNLACLLKAVESKYTTVDLRNEAYVCGKIQEVDGMMNLSMSNVLFSDPSGKCFNFDKFFVQAKNIRHVHLPREISIIPAINAGIAKAFPGKIKSVRKTFQQKRLQKSQEETLRLVANFHKTRGS
ncbi:unnamed protein product [Bemisia tabaci]|uniref:Sm domain-containing protein n=1 Tax=Bemisia tabaci TaxID=7038 RepID=A0A9P0A494_BEMTA|nr:PREDICTED: uncharacterized protein LOC109036002 [Bemisia tabaci]CAH0383851.1 unnamed protein product [Bemisia tabaci]